MGDLWNQSVDGKGVVLNAGPGGARQRLADALMQLGGATVFLDHAFEGCDLEISGVTRPLEHLEVQDSGYVFHRGTGEHFAGEVEHHYRRREFMCHCTQKRFCLRFVQPVL